MTLDDALGTVMALFAAALALDLAIKTVRRRK